MREWQPIETAPKDGCEYLLCTDGGIIFVGKYRKHIETWVCQDGRERWRTVTYWKPLPSPLSSETLLPTAHGTTGERG